jgi:dual specificity phosphatase 12
MFAKFPRTPSDSSPTTPCSPRRRIRCKMCRQELATREHMLDHGQLGPATPATSTPVTSRRPSASIQPRSRALSNAQTWPTNDLSKRRPSMLSDVPISFAAVDTEDSEGAKPAPVLPQHQDLATRRLSGHQAQALSLTSLRKMSRGANSTASASALEMEEEVGYPQSGISEHPPKTMSTTSEAPPADLSIKAAEILGRRLSHSMISSALETQLPEQEDHPTTHLISPNDLAAQLYAHPKLAELRSISGPSSPAVSTPVSAPILANSKCSGYFVEPVRCASLVFSVCIN